LKFTLLMHTSTALAIRCKDGIVMGVEKLIISKMLEPGSNRRVYHVDKHAGLVLA
jgi:20S proteasome subunit alpha 7